MTSKVKRKLTLQDLKHIIPVSLTIDYVRGAHSNELIADGLGTNLGDPLISKLLHKRCPFQFAVYNGDDDSVRITLANLKMNSAFPLPSFPEELEWVTLDQILEAYDEHPRLLQFILNRDRRTKASPAVSVPINLSNAIRMMRDVCALLAEAANHVGTMHMIAPSPETNSMPAQQYHSSVGMDVDAVLKLAYMCYYNLCELLCAQSSANLNTRVYLESVVFNHCATPLYNTAYSTWMHGSFSSTREVLSRFIALTQTLYRQSDFFRHAFLQSVQIFDELNYLDKEYDRNIRNGAFNGSSIPDLIAQSLTDSSVSPKLKHGEWLPEKYELITRMYAEKCRIISGLYKSAADKMYHTLFKYTTFGKHINSLPITLTTRVNDSLLRMFNYYMDYGEENRSTMLGNNNLIYPRHFMYTYLYAQGGYSCTPVFSAVKRMRDDLYHTPALRVHDLFLSTPVAGGNNYHASTYSTLAVMMRSGAGFADAGYARTTAEFNRDPISAMFKNVEKRIELIRLNTDFMFSNGRESATTPATMLHLYVLRAYLEFNTSSSDMFYSHARFAAYENQFQDQGVILPAHEITASTSESVITAAHLSYNHAWSNKKRASSLRTLNLRDFTNNTPEIYAKHANTVPKYRSEVIISN